MSNDAVMDDLLRETKANCDLRAEVARLTAELAAANAEAEMQRTAMRVAAKAIDALKARIEAGIAAAVCRVCGGDGRRGYLLDGPKCAPCGGTGTDTRVVKALKDAP